MKPAPEPEKVAQKQSPKTKKGKKGKKGNKGADAKDQEAKVKEIKEAKANAENIESNDKTIERCQSEGILASSLETKHTNLQVNTPEKI